MESVDPRFEKLVALLYGELSEDEEREIRRELMTDAALRAEWEGLQSSRTLLQGWQMEERAPRLVFVQKTAGAAGQAGLRRESGWRERFRTWLAAPAWGLAATAVLVAALALGGFRIDRVSGGLAFRFGGSETPPHQADSVGGTQTSPHLGPGSPAVTGIIPGIPGTRFVTDPGVGLGVTGFAGEASAGYDPAMASGAAPGGTGEGESPYITREEFDRYVQAMGRAVQDVMDEYARQRDESMTALLQGALMGLNARQVEGYRELRTRIDDLGIQVVEDQAVTRAQVNYLFHQVEPDRAAPVQEPIRSTGGNQ